MEMTEGLPGGVLGVNAQGLTLVLQTTAMDQWQAKLTSSIAERGAFLFTVGGGGVFVMGLRHVRASARLAHDGTPVEATVSGNTIISASRLCRMLYPVTRHASTDIRTTMSQIAAGMRFSSAASRSSVISPN
jgi:hypothetical protein